MFILLPDGTDIIFSNGIVSKRNARIIIVAGATLLSPVLFPENNCEHKRIIYSFKSLYNESYKGFFIKSLHPDFQYQSIAAPEELGNCGRVKWISGRLGEAPAYAGTDFIIARDGRIAAVYLFFDKLP